MLWIITKSKRPKWKINERTCEPRFVSDADLESQRHKLNSGHKIRKKFINPPAHKSCMRRSPKEKVTHPLYTYCHLPTLQIPICNPASKVRPHQLRICKQKNLPSIAGGTLRLFARKLFAFSDQAAANFSLRFSFNPARTNSAWRI